MKTHSTELNTAIDNYVKSVRILLATVICLPVIVLLGYYAPVVLITAVWVPPCLIVCILLVRENEKIKELMAWSDWMDTRLQSEEYLDALLYIQHRELTGGLGYNEYLIDKKKKGINI